MNVKIAAPALPIFCFSEKVIKSTRINIRNPCDDMLTFPFLWIGVIRAVTPRTKVELATILPTILPSISPLCLVLTAFRPNASSGNEVPSAVNVNPTKIRGMPADMLRFSAILTRTSLETSKRTTDITKTTKSLSRLV